MTSDGWKPVFTVWLDEGVVFQKGNEYKAMKLTSFNQMISDGWMPISRLCLRMALLLRKN